MPQRNYLTSTTALSLTASGTTVGSGNTTSATFEVARTMVRTGITADELANGSRTWSIHYAVSAMVTPYEVRLKLQRRNSAGVMQSESSYGTARSATGTYDDDITWDSGTWAANDQLALVWEHRRPSGTGSKNGTVDANGASYVDAALPIVVTTVTPAIATLATTGFTARLLVAIVPATALITTTRFAPLLRLVVTPATGSLTTTQLTPSLRVTVTPATTNLTTTRFAPALYEALTSITQTLNTTTFTPVLQERITPATTALTIATFTPSLLLTDNVLVIVPSATLTLISAIPLIRPFVIIFLDPGGDATRAVGHFNTDVNTTGLITFDNTQQVAGVGSYKFDSDTGLEVPAAANGVLDNARRVSCYFRYDSQPDKLETAAGFVGASIVYSGADIDGSDLGLDNGLYVDFVPAKNAGHGRVFLITSGGFDVPAGAVVDSVKIIYERKYDIDTSIGISRVKWVVDDEEGPNHDNANMPLTDTVVEVDVTADRTWEWQYFTGNRFKIIAEARRGDTDTVHTQSWDYVKVVVVYHLPAAIIAGLSSSNLVDFRVAIRPQGAGAVLRFVDGAGDSYDGITLLLVNTAYRISLAYVYHSTDNLDIKLYVNGIPELFITGASTGGFSKPVNLQYGWLLNPGANHLCWFNHLCIDNGDDLSDPGNVLTTAKLSAAVNENNWDTTGGTGAVNERPLSETNYIMQSAFSSVRQTYTLQAAATGDVDISTATLIGYMGWAWAKREAGSVERIGLIVNNVDVSRSSITTSPSLLKHPITSTSYPSHAAGIGMSSNSEDAGVFMYECGVVVAYRPAVVNPNSLMAYQVLAEGSTTNITDDLRADPQDSYELCYRIDDGDASVLITIYSIPSEGQPPQLQGICGGQGGYGRTRITPGIEVQVVLEVTGGSVGVSVWRRVNVD